MSAKNPAVTPASCPACCSGVLMRELGARYYYCSSCHAPLECPVCTKMEDLQFSYSVNTAKHFRCTCGCIWYWKESTGASYKLGRTKDGIDRVCDQCGGYLDDYKPRGIAVGVKCLTCCSVYTLDGKMVKKTKSHRKPNHVGPPRQITKKEWQAFEKFRQLDQDSLREFERFQEMKSQLSEGFNSLYEAIQTLDSALRQGANPVEEMEAVDAAAEALSIMYSEVVGTENEELWADFDRDDKERWTDEIPSWGEHHYRDDFGDSLYDRRSFHQNGCKPVYSDVSIEDDIEDKALL